MFSDKPGSRERREIVYRIGRKQGKIRWEEAGVGVKETAPHAAQPVGVRLLHFVWREAALLSERMLYGLVWAAPAIALLLTVVLAAALWQHAGK